MTKNRLEAFSDGVIAIIITIMVLELKVPHGTTLEALTELIPVFSSYVLSFIYVAIYWNNHHHMLHAAHRVSGTVMWANMHLLFWLSLVPFATGWMGENNLAPTPVALYAFVMLMAGVAYYILERCLVAQHDSNAPITRALGRDCKAVLSLVSYGLAVPIALVMPFVAIAIFVAIAVLWVIPDRRIEKALAAARD